MTREISHRCRVFENERLFAVKSIWNGDLLPLPWLYSFLLKGMAGIRFQPLLHPSGKRRECVLIPLGGSHDDLGIVFLWEEVQGGRLSRRKANQMSGLWERAGHRPGPDYPIIRRQRQRRGALLVVPQQFLAPAVHTTTLAGATQRR